MSYLQSVIEHFIDLVENKKACSKCKNKSCTTVCTDCLDYFSGLPSYGCKYQRCAYLIRYLYVHKAEMKKLVKENIEDIEYHLNGINNRLAIASIGAGPGSDISGIFEGTLGSPLLNNKEITLHRIDKEDNWNYQYHRVIDAYTSYLDDVSANLDRKKTIIDIAKTGFSLSTKADIVSMSYIISEILHNNGRNSDRVLRALWRKTEKNLSNNSILLINDRPQSAVSSSINMLVNQICNQYKESYAKTFSFSRYVSADDYHRGSTWCCETFPDEYVDKYKPKLTCSSFQCVVFIQK